MTTGIPVIPDLENVHASILVFVSFCFKVVACTKQKDGRADGQEPYYGLLRRPHNKRERRTLNAILPQFLASCSS